ncbi:MAG: TIGR04454 family lipoprotein [Spirochaetota bacterium]
MNPSLFLIAIVFALSALNTWQAEVPGANIISDKAQDGKKNYTTQECESTIARMIRVMKADLRKQELTEEHKAQMQQFDILMTGMKPKVIEKCRRGRMNLKCLQAAKNLTQINACFP